MCNANATHVYIHAHTYRDVLCFAQNGVTVGGDGGSEDCIISAGGKDGQKAGFPAAAVVCRAFDCRLINVTVEYAGTCVSACTYDVHTCIYTYICICVCMYMYIYIYIHKYVYVYIYIYIYMAVEYAVMCLSACVFVSVSVCMYDTHTCIYIFL